MKVQFLIVFIFWSVSTFAHQDIIYSVNKGNIHLQYLSGYGGLEIDNKIKIFVNICDKLVKNKFHNSEQLYIYFGHDYTKTDTSYYALGYGQFSFWDYEKYGSSNDRKTKGIKIIIRDRDFDIKKILLLVNSAFNNTSFIKTNQAKYYIKPHFYNEDSVNSIKFNQVQRYLLTPDSIVSGLLTQKYYRNLTREEDGRISYYFQNNQFHFYNTNVKEWSQDQAKYIITKAFDEDILVVDNIFEIFGNVADGYFIFITDSSFYFIPQVKDKIRGPFKIDSVEAGRHPISKYHHEYYPMEKFTLFINGYRTNNKVLFIPDSNLLIPNFDKLEDSLIKDFYKKKVKDNASAKHNKAVIVLSILLGLCILLIIALLRKRTK